MDIEKIFKFKKTLQEELNFSEISKLYREILYNEYENLKLNETQKIKCYYLLRSGIDIFTQMINGRKFDENYLRDTLKY